MKDIVSNCLLCEEHSLHVMNQNELKLMQCIHCGYASTDKFLGIKEDNEEYQKLTNDMKEWSIETGGRIWTPAHFRLFNKAGVDTIRLTSPRLAEEFLENGV